MSTPDSGLQADLLRHNLKTVTTAFCPNESGWWKIGLAAMGRRAQPKEIIYGTTPFQVTTYDRLMVYFSANWPDDVEWPAAVPRPRVDRQVSA